LAERRSVASNVLSCIITGWESIFAAPTEVDSDSVGLYRRCLSVGYRTTAKRARIRAIPASPPTTPPTRGPVGRPFCVAAVDRIAEAELVIGVDVIESGVVVVLEDVEMEIVFVDITVVGVEVWVIVATYV